MCFTKAQFPTRAVPPPYNLGVENAPPHLSPPPPLLCSHAQPFASLRFAPPFLLRCCAPPPLFTRSALRFVQLRPLRGPLPTPLPCGRGWNQAPSARAGTPYAALLGLRSLTTRLRWPSLRIIIASYRGDSSYHKSIQQPSSSVSSPRLGPPSFGPCPSRRTLEEEDPRLWRW